MYNKFILKLCLLIFCLINLSCINKEEWLDVKSNKNDIIPTTIEDFQALLDYDLYFNSSYPSLTQVSSDNFYITFDAWQTAYWQSERNAYIWAPKIFVDEGYGDWTNPYVIISYCNVVLEGLPHIKTNNSNLQAWNNVKGSALFYRAFAFFNLLQEFADPYDKITATTDLGVPLRLSSDVNEKPKRSTIHECYEQIIKDLKEAQEVLPMLPDYQTRPSQPAAAALLARINLNMANYEDALNYAEEALNQFNILLDFNQLDTSSTRPFPTYPNNKEIIIYVELSFQRTLYSPNLIVDSTLYQSYESNDLRRILFYRDDGDKIIRFKGNYTGNNYSFGGLATSELYLILAESYARTGHTSNAMATLNVLLVNRWKTGTFTPLTASNPEEALRIILQEKRKELPFTGSLRWQELRRLNKDPRFAKTLVRSLNDKTYKLPPDDQRYVFDIPDIEIELTDIKQNERE